MPPTIRCPIVTGSRVNPLCGFQLLAGIPGARGFMVSSGGAKRYSVLFSDGGCLHVVTVGFSSSAAEQPSRSRVAGVAAALYRRVHELR